MYRTIGIKFLTALIISLCAIPAFASDSLMDVREYAVKVYDILDIDSNGNASLDTATVRKFVFDGAIRTYSDIGDPRTKKIPVSAGVAGVYIDAGLISIVGVILDSNKTFQAMQQVAPNMLNDVNYYNNLTGTYYRPRYYIRHGDSIDIYPRPFRNDTVTVLYFARGAFPYGTKSDTVTIVMPLENRMAVVYATASLCELRRRNFESSAIYEKLYEQEVARLRSRFEFEGIKNQ